MENYFATSQLRPFSFLQKKVTVGHKETLQVHSQMPQAQILFFLNQAYQKRKPIVIQVNKTKHILAINEHTGILRYSPTEQHRAILESSNQNTTYMIDFKDIRHIRIVN